jgi:hypothetical protein
VPGDLAQTSVEQTQDAGHPPILPVGSPPPVTGAESLPARIGGLFARLRRSVPKKWAIPGCILGLILLLLFCIPLTSCDSGSSEKSAAEVSIPDIQRAFDRWSAAMRASNISSEPDTDIVRNLSAVDLSECPDDLRQACEHFISFLKEGMNVPREMRRDDQRAMQEVTKLSAAWGKYLD